MKGSNIFILNALKCQLKICLISRKEHMFSFFLPVTYIISDTYIELPGMHNYEKGTIPKRCIVHL
jgi:hypothetical protein